MNSVPLLDQCCANFEVHSGAQIGPRSGPKKPDFQLNFLNFLFRVLSLFTCLLRAVLSLLCSCWEPPRLDKYGFTAAKSHFLQLLLFGTLKLLGTFLGACWRVVAHFDSKLTRAMDPELAPKSATKMSKKHVNVLTPMLAVFGPLSEPFWAPKANKRNCLGPPGSPRSQ